MSSRSHLPLDLGVEDFERLGVRPDEIRLTVIRRAAARTSRALAESQLNAPSDTAALQLSRVTTSAYRLLDPRNRNDDHQRIHVGRILPMVLMWAGETKFQNQHSSARKIKQFEGEATESPTLEGIDASLPFQSGGLSEADLVEIMELDSTPLLAGQPAWAHSLSDVDILGRTEFFKRWNRLKLKLLDNWYLTGLAVVLLILFLASTIFSSGDQSHVNREPDSVSRPESRVLGSRIDLSASSGELSRFDPSTDESVADGPRLEVIEESRTSESEKTESDEQQSNAIVVMEPIPDTIFELENPVANLDSNSLQPDGGSGVISGSEQNPSHPSGFLPDPFQSVDQRKLSQTFDADEAGDEAGEFVQSEAPKSELKQESSGGTPRTASDPELNAGQVTDATLSIPVDSETVLNARKYLRSLDSSLQPRTDGDNPANRLATLHRLREPLNLASAEYWAVSVLLMECSWKTRGTFEVGRVLRDLQSQFVFQPGPLLVETYLSANVRSALPEVQQELLSNGLVLLDQLVVAAHFDLAAQILRSLEPLGRVLQDEKSAEYFLEYERAILQAGRQSERFEKLSVNLPATWSRSNRGLLGRHVCLVLRRWNDGLPWLCSASDQRIASTAKTELALPVKPDCDQLVTLARRWDLNAGRASGLQGDAMKLHAVTLLKNAMETATDQQRIELGLELQEMRESLPAHLRQAGFQIASIKN